MLHSFLHQEEPGLFKSLEHQQPRKRAFWTSVGVHGVLLVVLLVIPLIFNETLNLKFDYVELAPPLREEPVLQVTNWKLPPPPKVEPKPMVAPPPRVPRVVKRTPPPVVEPPRIEERPAPERPKVTERAPIPEPAPAAPAPPKPEVRTNVFSSGSSAKPTTNLPARKVQTGGFGDPNGVSNPGRPDKIANVASLGSFDLPAGKGAGNGTGGDKGVRGTVASAGFGNGVATPVAGSGKSVSTGGFGDASGGGGAPAARRRAEGPPTTLVEITYKPRPDYTEEARRRKIEGEVLVRAVFTATGEVRVMDVIRGLGFGLDENALRAAQQIRFKPALRNGQPIDSTATVHIKFQLAY